VDQIAETCTLAEERRNALSDPFPQNPFPAPTNDSALLGKRRSLTTIAVATPLVRIEYAEDADKILDVDAADQVSDPLD
jgi:hypothetical protein